jgi:sugar phosphate isomerase/epimerase
MFCNLIQEKGEIMGKRLVTLFTGQWFNMPLEELAKKAQAWRYDGLELACWGDPEPHFNVDRALAEPDYCKNLLAMLAKYGLKVRAISAHLVGQCVCDNIDERHKAILPPDVWGDGIPEGVRKRAAKKLIDTAKAAKKLGVEIVNGFTGSSIWHLLYSFPPVSPEMIQAGYDDFAKRFKLILDEFNMLDIKFCLEVHPGEIAYDWYTTEAALEAIKNHPAFFLNYDPSHLLHQDVDPGAFIRNFGKKIAHVHMKDVKVRGKDGRRGGYASMLAFNDPRRPWDFVSLGHGDVDFDDIIRALNEIGYDGPLSVEWEDSGMDREFGAEEACGFTKKVDFEPSATAFDEFAK